MGRTMQLEEAQTGTRVHPTYWRRDLRGQAGTIAVRWGEPHYVVLEVLLDDGRSKLLWHHELEEADGGAA